MSGYMNIPAAPPHHAIRSINSARGTRHVSAQTTPHTCDPVTEMRIAAPGEPRFLTALPFILIQRDVAAQAARGRRFGDPSTAIYATFAEMLQTAIEEAARGTKTVAVSQLSEMTDLPESTIRRLCVKHHSGIGAEKDGVKVWSIDVEMWMASYERLTAKSRRAA